TGDVDRFAVNADPHACCRPRFLLRAGYDALPVGAVDVAVGEPPGHVAVAAHHHGRQAGQGETLHVDLAARRDRVRVAQARAEPGAGRAQAQVHVVGDDGTAVACQRSRDGEVVAAPGEAGRRMRPTDASFPHRG